MRSCPHKFSQARATKAAKLCQPCYRDWEAAHRLHRLALAVLSDASSRYSIPRVRFDIEEVTEDTCLFFYRFTHAQLRRLQKAFQLPDVICTGGGIHARNAVVWKGCVSHSIGVSKSMAVHLRYLWPMAERAE
ncbi:hypothetical protein F444_14291 [Phytophthora nicotianae P1976]|uniref:Uncharacterized protein n=1 Tax=Phytophthora nicotianae P1976 TaxID=1317066 RepID=A0A080ZQU9_PHYNI|nr:hypothetical protein F444_14291 [Phytophthora nicotianae P1976]